MGNRTFQQRWLALFAVAGLALAGCGGGDNSITDPDGAGDDGTQVDVQDLTLITSSVSLPSDGVAPVTLSAIARDRNNNVVEGATLLSREQP